MIALAGGTIVTLKTVGSNNTNFQKATAITKTTAFNLKSQAIDALKANNNTKAESLFKQANAQHKTLKDTNNVVDTEAQIYLIEHSGTKTTK